MISEKSPRSNRRFLKIISKMAVSSIAIVASSISSEISILAARGSVVKFMPGQARVTTVLGHIRVEHSKKEMH